MHLKEHQEIIDKFRESFRKISQISNIQKDLNKPIDELQKKDQQNHEEVLQMNYRKRINRTTKR